MSTFQYKGQGLRSVGAYQVSGVPWVTGSSTLGQNKVHMVQFPYVTKSFTVINTNTTADYDIRVHFNSGSSAQTDGGLTMPGEIGEGDIDDTDDVIANFHYITVPAGNSSITFDVKCKEVFISQNAAAADFTYQVFAELTNISTGSMYHLTGSGITV